jgi:phosphohistidine phosphatase
LSRLAPVGANRSEDKMKTLLVLRHAKSSWDDSSLADFDRPLASRGQKAAKRIGSELATRGWLPDLALVSPAARTRQTWELVSAELPAKPPADFREALYAAPAEKILDEIKKAPETANTLLVLGHNPGLEYLARQIGGEESDADILERLRKKFPTAALARFTFDGGWQELKPNSARLTHFLAPKELG